MGYWIHTHKTTKLNQNMVVMPKTLLNPRLTLTLNIASNTPLNNNKNLSNDMNLPCRVEP
jgi:hypothetical protein